MAKFKKHQVKNISDWTEWIYPNRKKYKLACCDCGLVHDMQFDLIKRGLGNRIVFRAKRNTKSTGQMRRALSKNKNKEI